MTDDERAEWARTRPAVASHAIDLMEREIHELRRLAWDGADAIYRMEREIMALRRLAWDSAVIAHAKCARLGQKVILLHEFRRQRDAALAEVTRINQCLGEMEDLERETRQERDALRAAANLMAGVLFDEGADNDEVKRQALAAWEALTHD